MLEKKILSEIELAFGSSFDQVRLKFEEYIKGEEWVSHNKVLSAIIKLSGGDISKVDKYLNMAKIDPRDVIMLADEI